MFYPHFFVVSKKTTNPTHPLTYHAIHIQQNPPAVASQDPEDRPDAELLLDILGTCSSESSGTPPMLPLFLERFKKIQAGMETGDGDGSTKIRDFFERM